MTVIRSISLMVRSQKLSMNQKQIGLTYEEGFDKDDGGRPYVIVDGNKYVFVSYYKEYEGYGTGEIYYQDSPINESFTLYLVWNKETLNN